MFCPGQVGGKVYSWVVVFFQFSNCCLLNFEMEVFTTTWHFSYRWKFSLRIIKFTTNGGHFSAAVIAARSATPEPQSTGLTTYTGNSPAMMYTYPRCKTRWMTATQWWVMTWQSVDVWLWKDSSLISAESKDYNITAVKLSTVALEDQFGPKWIDIILDMCEVTRAGQQEGRGLSTT